jgi:hypothetical protein
MNKDRNLAMREYLDRLAAQDDRGDAAAAVRGHDDQVAVFRIRGIDDRPVGMLMLFMDDLPGDVCPKACEP